MSIPLVAFVLWLAAPASAWEIFGHCLQGDNGNCHDGSDGKICVPGDACYQDPWVQAKQVSSLIQAAEAAGRCDEKKCRRLPAPAPETIVHKADLQEYCSQGKCTPCSAAGARCQSLRPPETLKNELEKNKALFSIKSPPPSGDQNFENDADESGDAGVKAFAPGIAHDQIPRALAANASGNSPLSEKFNSASSREETAPAGPGKAYYGFADQLSNSRDENNSAGVLLGAQKALEPAAPSREVLGKGGLVDKVLSMVWWDKGANTEALTEEPSPDAQGKPSSHP